MFGERLKELRKKIGLKQAQVAEVLGLKQDAISKIEKNSRNLTSFEIFKLSKEYDIPIGFFYGEINLDDVLEVHLRATEQLKQKDKEKIPILKKIANKYYDIEDVLGQRDETILRRYSVNSDQFSKIREIALEERRILGFNESEPITNLEEILRSYGIKILQPLLDFSINGIFLTLDIDRFLIIINNENSPSMRNFTLAHEYGHYLLHRGNDFNIVTKNIDSPAHFLDKEKTANLFAAEFLMPEKSLDNFKNFRISEESATLYLQRYKVSRSALIFRLDNLNLIKQEDKMYYLDNYKPIEALKKLGLYSGEVEWNKRSNEIKKLPRKKREERKKFNTHRFLSVDYKDKVQSAYERGLITYNKMADYLFISIDELKEKIKPQEVFYEL